MYGKHGKHCHHTNKKGETVSYYRCSFKPKTKDGITLLICLVCGKARNTDMMLDWKGIKKQQMLSDIYFIEHRQGKYK